MSQFTDFECENLSNAIVDFEEKVPNGICVQCKHFGAGETGKCTYCTMGIIKCIKCKAFWVNPGDTYCSGCKTALLYDGVELTIKQIFDLPECPFKGIQIDNHLEEIFNDFKMKTGIKNKLIKNINEFKMLLNLCKNKESGEVFCILDGQRDSIPCILPAKFASQLFDQCAQNSDKSQLYKYVHAIAPFVYDIWNLSNKNSVLDCYYRDFGDLNKCPSNISILYTLWGRLIQPFATSNLTHAELCKCVCGKSIYLHDKKIRCMSCFGYVHQQCKSSKCLLCNVGWDSADTKSKFFGKSYAI